MYGIYITLEYRYYHVYLLYFVYRLFIFRSLYLLQDSEAHGTFE